MALEAALVLPIFLFFMMIMLLCLETVRFQSNLMEALHQSGNQKAVQEHSVQCGNEAAEYTEQNVRQYMTAQPFPYLCIEDGENGILLQDMSTVNQNGLIFLQVHYQIKSWCSWLPVGKIIMQDKFYGHAFTGYTGNELQSSHESAEIYVYITKTGSRYHNRIDCTHLHITIRTVRAADISACRNNSGEKYYPCERCKPAEQGLVYIAADGNRYHGQSNCSSIKREVYMIPLREAYAYTPCQKCGGR